MTTIETTTYHALRNHLVAEHGEALAARKAEELTEWRCWVPDISGWTEQLCMDGQEELADCWDALDAEDQSAMLRNVAGQWEDELAEASECLV